MRTSLVLFSYDAVILGTPIVRTVRNPSYGLTGHEEEFIPVIRMIRVPDRNAKPAILITSAAFYLLPRHDLGCVRCEERQ